MDHQTSSNKPTPTSTAKPHPGFIKRSTTTPLSKILATGEFRSEQTAADGDGYSPMESGE